MWRYSVIQITTEEPLKIGAGGSKASQTEPSKEYIPGSTLRGAVISRLVREGTFEQEKEKILLKMACYNAYPYRNNRLYLPVPRHLRMDKHDWREKKAAYDDRRQDHKPLVGLTDLLGAGEGQGSKNAPAYRFVTSREEVLDGKKEQYLAGVKVAKEYRLHHSSSKNVHKEKKENLFRYQAMAAEQTFRTIIRFAPELQETIESVFQQEPQVYLGGSRSSGYGLCRWKLCGEVLTDYRAAKELLGLPITLCTEFDGRTGEELRITCLSDVMLRNEYGQPVDFIPEKTIAEICGQEVVLKGRCVQTGLTEGYNTTWQAWYPKETTLKAGSVLQYTFAGQTKSEKELQKIAEALESRLLGSRNQDGLGWIGVNLPYPQKLLVAEDKRQKNEQPEEPQDLKELRQEEKIGQVMDVLLSGLEGAKARWLKMICKKSWGESEQEADAKKIIISGKLKKVHYRQMRHLLEAPLKKLKSNFEPDAYKPETSARFYKNDNSLCSIAKANFETIIKYLHSGKSDFLIQYAKHKLDTRQGRLFYADAKYPKRQLIAELLDMGLSIRIGGRVNEPKGDI